MHVHKLRQTLAYLQLAKERQNRRTDVSIQGLLGFRQFGFIGSHIVVGRALTKTTFLHHMCIGLRGFRSLMLRTFFKMREHLVF